jgi:putative membrane protein
MATAASILVALVGALHLWFLVLEMFLWQRPIGLRTFHLTLAFAGETATLAANQGLYNGFLGAGLLLTFAASPTTAFDARVFLLACIAIAGLYGAATVQRGILLVQALPAAAALAAVLAAGRP